MKKYIIPGLLIAALGLTSCEDAIDLTPKDTPTYIDYFTNAGEADLEMFTNPLYNNLLPEADDVAKEISDVMINANLSAFIRCGNDRTVPTTGGGWTWTNLRRCNDYLEYGKLCTNVEAYNKYAAVARFFRAYFYFEKVKRFGDVPWVDEPLMSDDPRLQNPRDSRELVMTKILEDLEYALEVLPVKEKVTTGEVGYRLSKGAALAMISRVCLFEGTYRKYHNLNYEEHDYSYYLQKAADAAEKLMSGNYGKYALLNTGNPSKDYATLFTQNAADPSEYILSRCYRNDVSGNQHGLTLYTELSTHGRPGFTRKFVCTYLMKDGSRFTDKSGWQTMNFLDEIKDRDPRLAQTIMTPGYTFPGESKLLAPGFGVTPTGYLTIKWAQGKGVCGGDPHSTQGRCDNDIPAMRFAETLLDYAEAKAELGTLTQEDLNKSVNLIRTRAGMPSLIMSAANATPDPYLASAETGYDNVSGANKGVILEIRRERTIELAQEARRIDDLMRWHQGKCIDQAFSGIYIDGPCEMDLKGNGKVSVVFFTGTKPTVANADDDCQYLEIGKDVFLTTDPAAKTGGKDTHGYLNYHAGSDIKRNGWNETRDYLYPIPSNEISLNKNLVQNPGW